MSLAAISGRAQIRGAMRSWILIALLALAAIPASSAAVRAQDDDETGGLVGLTLPVGARAVGQGRAIAAKRGELQAMPYNPAALSGIERGAVTYSRFEAADLAELSGNYIAGALATSWGTIAAQAIYQDYGEVNLTTDSPEPVGTAELAEWSVGVTYAGLWRERLAYGATAKWYRSDLGVVEASGPAFDVGVIYAPRPALPLAFAVSLRNVGPDLDFEEGSIALPGGGNLGDAEGEPLPSRVRVGLGVHPEGLFGLPEDYALNLFFDIESDLRELSTSSQHAGASLVLRNVIVLRGGFLLADNPFVEEGSDDRQVGGSFGVGIQYRGLEADVSREVSVSELGDETHFAVGWVF